MMNKSYTDYQSVEEFYGDWDDVMSPEDYEDMLDRKRFNQSQGCYAWDGIRNNYVR